jgi:hypothetical protein
VPARNPARPFLVRSKPSFARFASADSCAFVMTIFPVSNSAVQLAEQPKTLPQDAPVTSIALKKMVVALLLSRARWRTDGGDTARTIQRLLYMPGCEMQMPAGITAARRFVERSYRARCVCFEVRTGKHLLGLSLTGLDPKRS